VTGRAKDRKINMQKTDVVKLIHEERESENVPLGTCL